MNPINNIYTALDTIHIIETGATKQQENKLADPKEIADLKIKLANVKACIPGLKATPEKIEECLTRLNNLEIKIKSLEGKEAGSSSEDAIAELGPVQKLKPKRVHFADMNEVRTYEKQEGGENKEAPSERMKRIDNIPSTYSKGAIPEDKMDNFIWQKRLEESQKEEASIPKNAKFTSLNNEEEWKKLPLENQWAVLTHDVDDYVDSIIVDDLDEAKAEEHLDNFDRLFAKIISGEFSRWNNTQILDGQASHSYDVSRDLFAKASDIFDRFPELAEKHTEIASFASEIKSEKIKFENSLAKERIEQIDIDTLDSNELAQESLDQIFDYLDKLGANKLENVPDYNHAFREAEKSYNFASEILDKFPELEDVNKEWLEYTKSMSLDYCIGSAVRNLDLIESEGINDFDRVDYFCLAFASLCPVLDRGTENLTHENAQKLDKVLMRMSTTVHNIFLKYPELENEWQLLNTFLRNNPPF